MTLAQAIKGTGIARMRQGELIGIVDKSQRWHFAFTDGRLFVGKEDLFSLGEDWEFCPPDDPLLVMALEIIDRPVSRVGRLVDLLIEDVPAYIETPQGKGLYFFNGKRFSLDIPVDESVLFDRGWSVRAGYRPLKLIGCSS